MNLDADEQQNLIQKEKARTKEYSNEVPIMIGSKEHSCFINGEKGTKVILEDGTVIESRLSSEESHQRINQEIDKMDTMKPKLSKVKNYKIILMRIEKFRLSLNFL